ncbi:MAG: MotA/TolQ/ExbB proton channel family protein [Acidobacteriota bacterium]
MNIAALNILAPAATLSGFQTGIIELVAQSGAMAKFVLFILMLFSIVSWAIMVDRYRTLRRVERESRLFITKFNSAASLTELVEFSKLLDKNPLANIFLLSVSSGNPSPPSGRNVRLLKRNIRKNASLELRKIDKYLSFLATTASVTPFIGLFGTVWGIMNAFRGIGASGTASLAAYAPGIAEALITTAAGLAAAIPAVVAYNHFVRKVRVLSAETEEFIEDLVARIEEPP